jgi:hypothetical protein
MVQLCEFCVQNAGKPFVSEVSTNDFLKNVERIAVDKVSFDLSCVSGKVELQLILAG